jgi:transcriptional regulator with XRE-family HTH domain
MDIYSYICDISKNTRFAGSDGAKATKDYLVAFLDECGVKYKVSYSKMPNWSLNGTPQIEVVKPESYQFTAFPAIFSLPTEGYIEGQLITAGTIKMLDAFDWDKYAIVNNGIEIAYIIFEARQGKPIKKIAKAAGISKQAYRSFETPFANPAFNALSSIAKALGKNLEIRLV